MPFSCAAGELLVSQATPMSPGDRRSDWNTMLLQLALDTTIVDHGPYRIEPVPQMNRARLWQSAQTNRYPNFVFAVAYAAEHINKENITYIPFPVELGFLGYRVCFHPQSMAERINKKISDGDFKALTQGVQKDWEDADILRSNGYRVVKIPEYKSLFPMTAAGRFDLLCRGAAEVYDEYTRHSAIKGLALEQKIAFHYQIPVFYFANEKNKEVIKRVQTGLIRARNNGSMIKMFRRHYKERIDFVNLGKRKLIKLDNPHIEHLDKTYQKYNYLP